MTTVSDLQLSLALKIGENSVPNNTNEKARRLEYLNQGYRDVMRKHYWWFTETSTTFNSVANQTSYSTSDGLPSDLRFPIEVRFQGTLYSKVQQTDAFNLLSSNYSGLANSYFLFENKLYFAPVLSSSVVGGISMKYYRNYTKLTADSDTIIIPDQFADVLTAYAKGRVEQLASERGSAADAFDEYNEIIEEMTEEHNKYVFSLTYGQNDDIAIYP